MPATHSAESTPPDPGETLAPTPMWLRAIRSSGLQALLLTFVLAGMAWGWIEYYGGLELAREKVGPGAALITVPLQAVLAVSPFPDEVVGLGNSALYGFVPGALLNWIAWMLGSFLEYWVAHRAARDLEIQPKRFASEQLRFLRGFPPDHPVYLILTRFLPVGGGHIVNTTSGIFRVPLRRFAWTGAIGMIPGSLAIGALGNGFVLWAQ